MNDTATEELVITRVFDAPRELVYRAFTDPDQVSAWFGPVGFSVPRDTVDMDVRVGGHQRFTMVADDGSMTSPVNATFVELIPNELIVGGEDWDMPGAGKTRMTLRIELHDEDGKTRMVLRQGPFTPEMEGNSRVGWESSFTKLDTLLAG